MALRNTIFKATPIIETILAVGLAGAVTLSALDSGGGYIATQWWVALLVSILLIPGVLVAWSQGCCALVFPIGFFLAMLVWALAAIQTLELPNAVVAWVAPGSHEIYSDWIATPIESEALQSQLPAAQNLAVSRDSRMPISIAPSYTRMALAGPAIFASVCWLAFLFFRNRNAALVFLVVTAVAGAVFAFLGLADMIRLSRDWEFELRQRLIISPVGADNPFGPFVNNNNAGGYLNLSIGCVIGLLKFASSKKTSGVDSEQRLRFLTMDRLCVFGCVLMIIVLAAGIIGSGSRGGFLGLVTGAVVLGVLVSPGQSKWKVFGALVGIIALAWFMLDGLGVSRQSGERLETLIGEQALKDPRIDHWQDALRAAVHFFPMGAGLGAYRFAYLPFQKTSAGTWFVNADGMPIEWLLEGGLWLLPILICGLLALMRNVFRIAISVARKRDDCSMDYRLGGATVMMMAFAIPSLMVTQCFDFAIMLPPTLMLFSVMYGGVTQLASQSNDRPQIVPEAEKSTSRNSWRAIYRGSPLVLLLLAMVLAVIDLYAGMVAQENEFQLRKDRKTLLVDLPSLAPRIEHLEHLARSRPSDSYVHRTLAMMRLESQRRLGAEFLYGVQPDNYLAHQVWLSPQVIRHAAYDSKTGMSFDSLMLPSQSETEWNLARDEVILALLTCPLDDKARIMLVELDMIGPKSKLASSELLQQAGVLRCRTESVLKYLEKLAKEHPGGETITRLRELRTELRQN